MEKKKKILFVAFPESIHTSRWIKQLADSGYELHLLSGNYAMSINDELENVIYHKYSIGIGKTYIRLSKHRWYHTVHNKLNRFVSYFFSAYSIIREHMILFIENRKPDFFLLNVLKRTEEKHARWAAKKIRSIMPDIIHSLETQHSGYLVSAARRHYGSGFPFWVHSNWGADIHLFGRLPHHREKIREVLAGCNLYLCECRRDIALAREFGYTGRTIDPFPNTGGLDHNKTSSLTGTKTSERRLIALKGYQGWAGRALTGIRALERCADALQGYEIAIYLGFASQEVTLAGELLEEKTGIPVHILPYISHEEMLRLHGRCRISIGLSLTDAISTSLLEAMAMGSFPVQSYTGCADEWVTDGETALLVPPEDPDAIEKAIRQALADDGLVDRAAAVNMETIRKRADFFKLKELTSSLYGDILKSL